jgi:microcompartment protein CcmL/EutN
MNGNIEAIALVELNSIAQGITTCDEMLKVAPVTLMLSMTICPGKYITLVGGEVSAVHSSFKRGVQTGAQFVVDSLFIPNIHEQVFPAVMGTGGAKVVKSLGVIETFSVASSIVAGDGAAKAAKVELVELRLAQGLAGKAFVTMTGDISDVEAGVRAGVALIKDSGMLVKEVIIPRPHHDLRQRMG